MRKTFLTFISLALFSISFISCTSKTDLLMGKWSLVQSQKLKGPQVVGTFSSPVLMVLKKDGSGFSEKKTDNEVIRRKITWTYKKPFLRITSFSPENKSILRLWEVLKLDDKILLVGYGSNKIQVRHLFRRIK